MWVHALTLWPMLTMQPVHANSAARHNLTVNYRGTALGVYALDIEEQSTATNYLTTTLWLQARLAEEPRDVDMKRMREDTSDSEVSPQSETITPDLLLLLLLPLAASMTNCTAQQHYH